MLNEKARFSSRLNRMRYYTEMILQEPASKETPGNVPIIRRTTRYLEPFDMFALGNMGDNSHSEYYEFLKSKGLLKTGSEFWFYFYAIRGNVVYSHHHDISRVNMFRFYINNVDVTGKYHLEPQLCRIVKRSLVSRSDLIRMLAEEGFTPIKQNYQSDYYYALKVKVINDSVPVTNLNAEYVDNVNGNDSFSQRSPKVLRTTDLEKARN